MEDQQADQSPARAAQPRRPLATGTTTKAGSTPGYLENQIRAGYLAGRIMLSIKYLLRTTSTTAQGNVEEMGWALPRGSHTTQTEEGSRT